MSNRKAAVLDMTQGSAVRMILKFAIPLFIGNIFQQVYSMVDTMVAGYCLGDQAIAAIGATSSLQAFFQFQERCRSHRPPKLARSIVRKN